MDSNEKIQQMHFLEQNLQAILMQKQAFQAFPFAIQVYQTYPFSRMYKSLMANCHLVISVFVGALVFNASYCVLANLVYG